MRLALICGKSRHTYKPAEELDGMEKITILKSADDISALLEELVHEHDGAVIKRALVRITAFIRSRRSFTGKRTESIAELEPSIIRFFDAYQGNHFEELYSMLREIVTQIPKFHIFGINISELRDITHDFDAAYRYHPAFKSIAADIRKLVHQHLSEQVITKIEKLEAFLSSAENTISIDGSTIIGATDEDKQKLLTAELFHELLGIKNKLKIAWTHKDDSRTWVESQEGFLHVLGLIVDQLPEPALGRIQEYETFKGLFDESRHYIQSLAWDKIPMGKLRYSLLKLIQTVMQGSRDAKGELAFRLITVDALLERFSFIYYSNLVNATLHDINGRNFREALTVLCDLALCTCAVGHGTMYLGRFAFLIEHLRGHLDTRPDRESHIPTIVDAMNGELENNFSYLQELYAESMPDDDKLSAVTRILNNIIREKTTHLLGNLINSLKTYFDRQRRHSFENVLMLLSQRGNMRVRDMVFTFGTDSSESYGDLACPEFMGGKGFSQVRNSMIILKNNLRGLDVPRGIGLSTLTWHLLKNNDGKIHEFRQELARIITELEGRTGRRFGDEGNPLLLMARSGGVVSMPGVLDTISHIGINESIAARWGEKLYEPSWAWQAYISFMFSYAKSVLGLNTDGILRAAGFQKYDGLLQEKVENLAQHACTIRSIIQSESGSACPAIPDEPFEQIYNAAIAVFKSYENETVLRQAGTYGIPEQFQTACLIQECLPILSADDCSGVFFTRNPAGSPGGAHKEQIEFGRGYFGNVIADGMVSPESLEGFIAKYGDHYERLREFKYFDEREQRYPTDIEFAIRGGRIYVVQSRILRQSPAALIINSYDFYTEGIYSNFTLIKRTAFGLNRKIMNTYLERKEAGAIPVIALGKPVHGGAVRGRLITHQNSMEKFDGPFIFLTESNVPPKVIMREKSFAGYISKEGGVTSHAALIAIGEKKPCVTDVHWERGTDSDAILLGGTQLQEGDFITLDANTGSIYKEAITIIESSVFNKEFHTIRNEIIRVLDDLISENLDQK